MLRPMLDTWPGSAIMIGPAWATAHFLDDHLNSKGRPYGRHARRHGRRSVCYFAAQGSCARRRFSGSPERCRASAVPRGSARAPNRRGTARVVVAHPPDSA